MLPPSHPKTAYECEVECCDHAAAIVASEDLAVVHVDLAKHPDCYIKKVLIDPQGSGTKTVTISTALSNK